MAVAAVSSDVCKGCAAGKFAASLATRQCSECAADSFSSLQPDLETNQPGATQCQQCKNMYYTHGATGSTSEDDCAIGAGWVVLFVFVALVGVAALAVAMAN